MTWEFSRDQAYRNAATSRSAALALNRAVQALPLNSRDKYAEDAILKCGVAIENVEDALGRLKRRLSEMQFVLDKQKV